VLLVSDTIVAVQFVMLPNTAPTFEMPDVVNFTDDPFMENCVPMVVPITPPQNIVHVCYTVITEV